MPIAPDAGEISPLQQQLRALICDHFAQANARVEPVYQRHFASAGVILNRHWRHKSDIPHDLMALPRSLSLSLLKLGRRISQAEAEDYPQPIKESGKQAELRNIINEELLDLPGLEEKLEQFCQQALLQYQQQIADHPQLNADQQQQFHQYVQHQIDRLHLTNEGMREGLLALTIVITGRALGDKAILSSAASLGGTLASSVYIGQQGWLAALWASWMGVPGWVSVAGASAGILSLLILSPLLAPGLEWGVNRLRSRTVLEQTVNNAEQQLLKKDGLLAASKIGVYLQLLPDIAQFIQKLR